VWGVCLRGDAVTSKEGETRPALAPAMRGLMVDRGVRGA